MKIINLLLILSLKMKIIEIIISVLFLAGIIFRINEWSGSSLFIVVSLMIASWYFLIFGFAIFSDIKTKNIFISARYKTNPALQFVFAILLGISLSTITVGIMYKMQNWETQLDILIFGLIYSAIVLALFYFLLKDKIKKKKIIFLRSFIIIASGLIVLFVC